MSGSGELPAGDERQLLAAEFVLGLLPQDERALIEREARSNPDLQAAIEAWEQHLLPLSHLVAAVPPPTALWRRIEATIAQTEGGASAQRAPRSVDTTRRRLGAWKALTGAGFALAAGLAAFMLLQPPAPPPPATALAPLGARTPIFIAQLLPDGGLLVRPAGPVDIPDGKDLQLWLLRRGTKIPVSLGLLPPDGRRLPAGSLPAEHGGARILFSLEPRGGSPTGLPTGPVLGGGVI